MSNAAYKRWKDTEWWREGYENLWKNKSLGNVPNKLDEVVAEESTAEAKQRAQVKLKKTPQTAGQDTVVYLTADSSEELSELKEGETYIIGGICDHNRYKVHLDSDPHLV